MSDECMHLLLVAKRKERNQSHQRLKHDGVRTNERTVDTIQQHYELLSVTTQLRKLL